MKKSGIQLQSFLSKRHDDNARFDIPEDDCEESDDDDFRELDADFGGMSQSVRQMPLSA